MPNFKTPIDNFLQFAPLAATYGFEWAGMTPKTDWKNQVAITVKSQIIALGMVYILKTAVNETRPDGTRYSFPSGHTTEAFAGATLLATEYGENYKWVPYVAYGTAASVGALRIANNRHYLSDVLFGAGLGILSTKIAYWTHQYKWNKKPTEKDPMENIYKPKTQIKDSTAVQVQKDSVSVQIQKDSLETAMKSDNFQKFKISDTENYIYQKPKFTDIFRKFGENTVNTAKDVISKTYYPYSLASLGATAALIPADPFLTRNARSLGKSIGFDYNHTFNKIGPLKIVPTNINTLLYFLGNGTAVIFMGGGFAAYGILTKNYRAESVSAQLVQSILLSGLYSQTMKRITGRESPFITDEEGRENSRWLLFPSISGYQKDTSRYDAMPSGHLMTGLSAWMVIAENYPEYKWIKPLGFSILGLMSFEMVQSGVHWTSDYPIAVLFGYLIGKNIAKSAIQKENSSSLAGNTKKYRFNFSSSSIDGIQTYGVDFVF
jgi:membrane-associated phospholipid phosphatase